MDRLTECLLKELYKIADDVASTSASPNIQHLSRELKDCIWSMELNLRNPWYSGVPTEHEQGDYLVAFKMSDGGIEYGWCVWDGKAWDIMCDYDPTDGSCEIIAWQRINIYGEFEIPRDTSLRRKEND